ncbi:MAG: T9SS type A sorting domain-containing protein [Candidatus Marinimicrobia bacterium]|jgi:PhoPQ-activated pathogenicity-related protein|nr:T9SS type A sorting domain-containing protein [Candidatus Neomarinimicrobiota bacterium]MBT3501142.1 T9SS type A sorting domain-containing protein [Candidatus Neomarinimicrobiota bacterium]MBT3840442.1 T9SS type A sorting domain-containing protein [Candidatus Neomarinimicrobiota bacterium]MBT4000008.1 T9SS type A sorting domain-containing protein [Candidatus Neomarinimicrobiota bacterium]MBT5364666.1 T9SS type A sorting domain-containing protein [Candidatus Neomarinimicrobiota bacterium]
MIINQFRCCTKLYYLFFFLTFLYGQNTILDEYVNRPDSTWSYTLHNTIDGNGYTGYNIELYSQTWRSTDDVDQAHWQHWINIIVPDGADKNKAMLLIGGGSNGGSVPNGVDETLVNLAFISNSVIMDIQMIPNEPVQFSDEDFTRSEDAIIAYTWDKYLNTGDSDWPLQLPMVKSVVKAMDVVQLFFSDELGTSNLVEEFILLGASKRGWTTWLTGIVDDRVHSIIPIVFDALNLVKSFKHHYGAYGFWSPAVQDYEDAGIFDRFSQPEIYDLMEIVDPLNYLDRLELPKFLIHASGDEFFVPSSQFYLDQLPGVTYQRYIPNTGHGMDEQFESAIISLMAFYRAMLNDYPLPEFSWEIQENGSIQFETISPPTSVRLWTAHNPNEFDFRFYTMGALWEYLTLSEIEPGVYVGEIPEPDSGYSALFIEAIYPTTAPYYFTFTTDVSFLPNQLPHATRNTTFMVYDSTMSGWDGYYIVGDMTSGLPLELNNNGEDGDQFVGDNVWSGSIDFIIDGEYEWDVYGQYNGEDILLTPDESQYFEVENGGVFYGVISFINGSSVPLDVDGNIIVEQFHLYPSYPNPFNPSTTIRFDVKTQRNTILHIFDINGRLVISLVDEVLASGTHEVQWNASQQSSGIYFVELMSGKDRVVQKIVLLK